MSKITSTVSDMFSFDEQDKNDELIKKLNKDDRYTKITITTRGPVRYEGHEALYAFTDNRSVMITYTPENQVWVELWFKRIREPEVAQNIIPDKQFMVLPNNGDSDQSTRRLKDKERMNLVGHLLHIPKDEINNFENEAISDIATENLVVVPMRKKKVED